jgi:hypothetical protein
MPRMTDRERLVDLEARQRKINAELEAARTALRARYGAIIADLCVENIPERDFRGIVQQVIRVGSSAGLVALTALPSIKPPQ